MECKTHELMGCECHGNGSIPDDDFSDEETAERREEQKKSSATNIHQLMKYEHHRFPFDEDFIRETGLEMVQHEVSFIFRHRGTQFTQD
jgi:hypothetical protein